MRRLATKHRRIDRRGEISSESAPTQPDLYSPISFDGLDRLKISAGPVVVTVTGGGPGPFSDLTTDILQQIITNFYDTAVSQQTGVNALGEKPSRSL